jgi:hypothetical protein
LTTRYDGILLIRTSDSPEIKRKLMITNPNLAWESGIAKTMLQEEVNRNISGRQDQGGGLGKDLEWEKIKGGEVFKEYNCLSTMVV